jgi:hypothetical protein
MDLYQVLRSKADRQTLGAALIAYAIGLLVSGLSLLLAPIYCALGVAGLLIGGGYLVGGVAMVRRRLWATQVVVAAAGAHVAVGLSVLVLLATASAT